MRIDTLLLVTAFNFLTLLCTSCGVGSVGKLEISGEVNWIATSKYQGHNQSSSSYSRTESTMSEGSGMASQYQVLEELGSEYSTIQFATSDIMRLIQSTLGGSFGTVYKAIEKATGEIVAIKHVSVPASSARHPQTDNPFPD